MGRVADFEKALNERGNRVSCEGQRKKAGKVMAL